MKTYQFIDPIDFHYRHRIFLSYRWRDVPQTAARLFEALQRHQSVEGAFFDRASISDEDSWKETIEQNIAVATAVMVVVGPRWRSLLAPKRTSFRSTRFDFVHWEVARALSLRKVVVVVYVDVDDGTLSRVSLPRALALLVRKRSCRLSSNFTDNDIDHLLSLLSRPREATPDPASRTSALVQASRDQLSTMRLRAATSPVSGELSSDARDERLTVWSDELLDGGIAQLRGFSERDVVSTYDDPVDPPFLEQFERETARDEDSIIDDVLAPTRESSAWDSFVLPHVDPHATEWNRVDTWPLTDISYSYPNVNSGGGSRGSVGRDSVASSDSPRRRAPVHWLWLAPLTLVSVFAACFWASVPPRWELLDISVPHAAEIGLVWSAIVAAVAVALALSDRTREYPTPPLVLSCLILGVAGVMIGTQRRTGHSLDSIPSTWWLLPVTGALVCEAATVRRATLRAPLSALLIASAAFILSPTWDHTEAGARAIVEDSAAAPASPATCHIADLAGPTATEILACIESDGKPAVGIGDRDSSSVAYLQFALNSAGYGQLALDGMFGPRTRRALDQFCAYQQITCGTRLTEQAWKRVDEVARSAIEAQP